MKKPFCIYFFVCLVCFVSKSVLAQETETPLPQIADSIVKASMEEYNVPGAVIGIVQKDSTMVLNAYGVQDKDNKVPVNSTKTLFRIGSITKNFTALALMQLVEKGMIDLHKDANNYLTSYKIENRYERKITPYDLITHSAGLDDHLLGAQSYDYLGPETLAPHVAAQFPDQIHKPGEVYKYSSYGVALIAVIIEDVSGMSFSDYVQQNIFDPVGMTSTSFFVQDIDQNNLVSNYESKGEKLIPYKTIPGLYIYPTGSLMTTAEDMVKYMKIYTSGGVVNGKQILKPQTVKEMRNSIFGPFVDRHIGMSIGFFNNQANGNKVYYHSGGIDGNVSLMRIYPEYDLGIFIAANARAARSSLVGAVSKELENVLLENKDSSTSGQAYKTDVRPEDLKRYTGKYRSISYSSNTVQKLGMLMGYNYETQVITSGNKLVLLPSDTLRMLNNGQFWSEENNQPTIFTTSSDGDMYMANPRGFYERISFYDESSFQINWVLLIVAIQVLSLLIYLLFFFIKKLRKKRPFNWHHRLNIITALSILVFVFILAFITSSVSPWSLFYGVPQSIKLNLLIPFLTIILIGINIFILLFKRSRKVQSGFLKFIGIITLFSQLSFVLWLNYWNLIGFNYY